MPGSSSISNISSVPDVLMLFVVDLEDALHRDVSDSPEYGAFQRRCSLLEQGFSLTKIISLIITWYICEYLHLEQKGNIFSMQSRSGVLVWQANSLPSSLKSIEIYTPDENLNGLQVWNFFYGCILFTSFSLQ